MGCNSIHSIDLISFVSGETDFRITSSELDIEILASKRKGFLEFTGALHGISSNGSKYSLISYKESNAPRVIKFQEILHDILFLNQMVNPYKHTNPKVGRRKKSKSKFLIKVS